MIIELTIAAGLAAVFAAIFWEEVREWVNRIVNDLVTAVRRLVTASVVIGKRIVKGSVRYYRKAIVWLKHQDKVIQETRTEEITYSELPAEVRRKLELQNEIEVATAA